MFLKPNWHSGTDRQKMMMFVPYTVANQQSSLRLGDWLGTPVPPDTTAWLPQGLKRSINISTDLLPTSTLVE